MAAGRNLPPPVTVTDMYLAAILAELESIQTKLDALQPQPVKHSMEQLELREPAAGDPKTAKKKGG